jgi:hypothetical protein
MVGRHLEGDGIRPPHYISHVAPRGGEPAEVVEHLVNAQVEVGGLGGDRGVASFDHEVRGGHGEGDRLKRDEAPVGA